MKVSDLFGWLMIVLVFHVVTVLGIHAMLWMIASSYSEEMPISLSAWPQLWVIATLPVTAVIVSVLYGVHYRDFAGDLDWDGGASFTLLHTFCFAVHVGVIVAAGYIPIESAHDFASYTLIGSMGGFGVYFMSLVAGMCFVFIGVLVPLVVVAVPTYIIYGAAFVLSSPFHGVLGEWQLPLADFA